MTNLQKLKQAFVLEDNTIHKVEQIGENIYEITSSKPDIEPMKYRFRLVDWREANSNIALINARGLFPFKNTEYICFVQTRKVVIVNVSKLKGLKAYQDIDQRDYLTFMVNLDKLGKVVNVKKPKSNSRKK